MKPITDFDFQKFVVPDYDRKTKPVMPVMPRLNSVTPSKSDLAKYLVDKEKYETVLATYTDDLALWNVKNKLFGSQCKSSWDKFVNELIEHLELTRTPEMIDIVNTFGSSTGCRRGSSQRMTKTYDAIVRWKGEISEFKIEKIGKASLGSLSTTDIDGLAVAIHNLENTGVSFVTIPNTKESYSTCMAILNSDRKNNSEMVIPEIVCHGKVIRIPTKLFTKYLLMRIGRDVSKY